MTTAAVSDSRIANLSARSIAEAYRSFDDHFRIVTRRARIRFQDRDWRGMASDASQRFDVYGKEVSEAVDEVRRLMADRVDERMMWAAVKAVYSGLIQYRDDWDVAESFFNSVTRKIFTTVGVDPSVEFVDTDFGSPPHDAARPVYRTYQGPFEVATLVDQIISDARLDVAYRSLAADSIGAARTIGEHLRRVGALRVIDRAEVVDAVFYRGKAAYLVGRIYSGSHVLPLVLALLHPEEGVVLDAVLLTENQVSILFSFARSYFHVDSDRPYDLVRFLRSLMPRKRLSEIYISIGHHKHGKTALFRELRHHLSSSGERFEIARGTRGLVMVVFTLPGFDVVIKVIKDRFPSPKRTTPGEVRERYRMVFRSDRAGRLVDAQEFEHLEFEVGRFTPELREVLAAECGRSIQTRDRTVVLSHAYIERRVIPLDIYLRDADPSLAAGAIVDYGRAIKELAFAGTFPGDLLLKNFGVTRHGRVVFYDYDEITSLARCVFRDLPESVDPIEEMAAEPWFAVGPDDVFPEEFSSFLGVEGFLRDAFLERHSDLLTARWWQDTQTRVAAGEMIDIFPYEDRFRIGQS